MNTFNKVCAAFMAAVMLCAVQPHGATIVVRGPVIAAAAGGETEIASDNFTYGNGTSVAGLANWDATLNDWAVSGGAATPNASAALSCVYETSTYSANQYSQATLSSVGGSSTAGVAVRCQSGSSSWYYLIYNGFAGEVALIRVNSGTETSIQSTAKSPSAGYKLKLTASGTGASTRLNAYEDTGSGWVALWTNQDPGGTYIDGGKPGMAGYGSAATIYLDDWSGGNL